jgi:hypothetical protein
LVIFGGACAFCWPVFAGRLLLPADVCLLMLPWRALAPTEFPWFHQPHNPMLDPIQQYLPWRIYAVDSLRSGLIPLWNPYAFCGTPFLANLQSTVLYPLNLLFLITGARHGFGVSAILHLTLGGLFTHWFLITLGLRRPAALLGALVVMFNSYTVSWLEYPTLSLWVFMWLPAILLCYEHSLGAPRSFWPIVTALAMGLQFLGGHLQISAYVIMACLIYGLARLTNSRASGLPAPRVAALFLLPLLLGLGLAAGQILPTLELAGQTGRAAHGARGAITTAFPLTHFVLYLIPNFFGNPADYNYWGSYRQTAINFFETACYLGILPLLLGVWSLRRWREPAFRFFAALALFAVLAAIGSPLYLLLYHLAPGFRELAGLGRILCLAAFGLAGLAAMGLDDLLVARSGHSSLTPVLAFSALTVVLVLASLFIFQPAIVQVQGFPSYLGRQVAAFSALLLAGMLLIHLRFRLRLTATAFASLALLLVTADLFWFGMGFNPFTDPRMAYPETESIHWLKEHVGHDRFTSLAPGEGRLDWMPHNAPMIFGLRDIHGSDSLRVRRSFELVSPPGANQALYPDPDSTVMDQLGVRYLMTRRQLSGRWRLVHSAEAPIYENLDARPRASLTSLPDRPLTFGRDDPDAIALTVDSDQGGQLIVTDSYYPGWRAWVDGKPAAIGRVSDGAFRSLLVPAGKHTVEMRYEPATFRVGLFVSLVAGALLAGAASALCFRRSTASATAARS